MQLVIDPHSEQAIRVEDKDGVLLGIVTPLDAVANCKRKRNKSEPAGETVESKPMQDNMVEIATEEYYCPKEKVDN